MVGETARKIGDSSALRPYCSTTLKLHSLNHGSAQAGSGTQSFLVLWGTSEPCTAVPTTSKHELETIMLKILMGVRGRHLGGHDLVGSRDGEIPAWVSPYNLAP